MSHVDVSDLDGDFSAADGNAGGDFERVPDGFYQVRVDVVEFMWTKSEPLERIFRWTYQVLIGQHTNRKLWKRNPLTPDKLKWLKSDVWKCGLRVNTLTELQRNMHKLLDVWLEVEVKTKEYQGKQYQNIYITKLIDGKDTERPNTGNEPPPPGDGDIPF